MALIEKWRGKLTLPPLPERRRRVGGNLVMQRPFLGAVSPARVAQAQEHKGHDLITTSLLERFDQRRAQHPMTRPLGTCAEPDPIVEPPDVDERPASMVAAASAPALS